MLSAPYRVNESFHRNTSIITCSLSSVVASNKIWLLRQMWVFLMHIMEMAPHKCGNAKWKICLKPRVHPMATPMAWKTTQSFSSRVSWIPLHVMVNDLLNRPKWEQVSVSDLDLQERADFNNWKSTKLCVPKIQTICVFCPTQKKHTISPSFLDSISLAQML